MTEKSEWQFLVDYVKDDTTDFYNAMEQKLARWKYRLMKKEDVDVPEE